MKNTLKGIDSRITEVEEQISELEDRIMEITNVVQNKGKRMKRNGTVSETSVVVVQLLSHVQFFAA